MPNASLSVATADKLLGALANNRCDEIIVEGVINALPTLKLRPGVAIRGGSEDATLVFAADVDGLQLTRDNTVEDLCISASIQQRALFNDTRQSGFGILHLARLTVYGQVQLIAADKLQTGHVEIDGLDIVAADARGSSVLSSSSNAARGKVGAKASVKTKAPEKLDVYGVGISEGQQRPHGFGVHVIQGAFTLWNMQPDPSSLITADLRGISVGRASAPVLGSGVFVSGSVVKGVNGGKLSVALLETGAIYSNGMIAPGTPDQITGGVFVVYNAFASLVRNLGPVTTYGVNDMVLDNWGVVDQWEAQEKITSFGPSGIGFVNFGVLNELYVLAPVETFGTGSRGFNVYDGHLGSAEFDRIVTHGDGSVGVQISKPISHLHVHRGIETFGASGDSLVKGVVVNLSAIALSVKPGGSAASINIEGGLTTHGKGIAPLEMQGNVTSLHVDNVSAKNH